MIKNPKRKRIILILILGLSGVLATSTFLPLISAQPPPSFTIPCAITDYSNSAWEGEFAYGLFQYNPSNLKQQIASYLVITDTNGNLLDLREWPGSSYLGSVNYIAPSTILFQGEGGSSVHFWNYSSDTTIDFPNVAGHHDVEYNPINNTFLTLNNYVREVNGTSYLFDKIVEFNSTGSILWTWDT